MPSPFGDHKVDFRREEVIAEDAIYLRRAAGIENDGYFDIVSLVESMSRGLTGRPFKIEFFEMEDGAKPAFVKFRPRTLHVDTEIWELARQREPRARFIVAHEIGHLLLHDHFAKAFSDDPRDQLQYAVKEQRAEWQAHTLAGYLLLPTHIVSSIGDVRRLAESCSVPRVIAEERLIAVKRAHGPKYLGECCGKCGNFSILPDGVFLKCDTCGQKTNILTAAIAH